MTAALSLGVMSACSSGAQNTSNSVPRNSASNGPMNSNMMNSNAMSGNSGAMNNINSNTAVVQDNFWTNAAQGGLAEVEMSKLAAAKATNAEVKKFAQMMVSDHTKASSELKTLAEKKKVVLPTDLKSGDKSTLEDLKKLSGPEFDKEYVKAMVEAHETDVDLFEDNTDNSDADIKAFTTKTLPTLKKHLEMIKNIQSKMK